MYSIIPSTIVLLVSREFKRVLKEPSRLFGMLMQPLLFLVVFGTGFKRSFGWAQSKDTSYAAFFFPGILGLVLLFATIYATLTLVEDKKCGLFRMVLISPSGTLSAILGKVVATALLGFTQSLLFLSLLPFFALSISLPDFFLILFMLLLGSLACALLGVLFAWLSPSSSAFHALMSVILIPMWLFSGAMFPIENTWFEKLSVLNPMSPLVAALRALILGLDFSFSHVWILLIFSFFLSVLLSYAVRLRPLE